MIVGQDHSRRISIYYGVARNTLLDNSICTDYYMLTKSDVHMDDTANSKQASFANLGKGLVAIESVP